MFDDDPTALFERAECARRDAKALRDRSRMLCAQSLKLLATLILRALNNRPEETVSISLELRNGKVVDWRAL